MRRFVPIALVVIFSLLTGLVLSKIDAVRNLDELFGDALIRYVSPATKVSEDIVLVLLDEETMKGLPYRSPVPRDFLAELNEKILEAKPRVIGYDIFFKDPTLEANDERLAASFKRGRVYAVSAGRLDEAGRDYEDLPMPLFLNSLKGVGLSDLPFSSSDAVVRYAQFEFQMLSKGEGTEPLPYKSGTGVHPSFVAALYHAATGGRAEAVLHDPKNSFYYLGMQIPPYPPLQRGEKIGFPPLKKGGKESIPPFVKGGEGGFDKTRIRFISPDDSFKTFPAHLVVKGLIPPAWLEDKIVLIGASYDDGTDAYITPFYSARYNYKRIPGVVIHANILNQLLTKQFYYYVPQYLLIIGFIVTGLFAALFFLFGPMWRGVTAFTALSLIIFIKAITVSHLWSVMFPVVPFEGSLILTFGACLGWRSVTEGKQKRFIKSVFAKYVPPSVVDKMIANPKLLTLGGEQREITAIFTDIASFTTISEKLDPKTLVEFLNQYLDRLTRIIFKYGGTLDKYEGDAIIAFFGAPVALENHREAACCAAIEMQKASGDISLIWKERCGMDIVTRIGIHSGQAVVGNMGSDLRFDYTAIGDTMNLASRLEGANKFFGTRVLASWQAVAQDFSPATSIGRSKDLRYISNDILFRPVARVKVKGKTEAVGVYEIIGLRSELTQDTITAAENVKMPDEVVELTGK